MMNWLRVLLFLMIAIIGCTQESPSKEKAAAATVPGRASKAPDFKLKDLQGREVSLSDYRDKNVLLVFSTTWCGFCRREIPHIKELYQRYGGKKLEILNIYIDEPAGRVSTYAAEYGLPYRILVDSEGKVAESYNVRGVPFLVLVGKDGAILCYSCRSIDMTLDATAGA
jgi:peroxiredoxin